MRVNRVETLNFAGLGDICVEGLGEREAIFVSGRNGVGKSQLLLAIAIAAHIQAGDLETRKFIGPDSPRSQISVDFSLNPEELTSLNDLGMSQGWTQACSTSTIRSTVILNRYRYTEQIWTTDGIDPGLDALLKDPSARAALPFTDVTYLPADRSVTRTPELAFSLSSLSRTTTTQLREQTLLQQLSDWSPAGQVFDVFSSLAALHYAGMLTERKDGLPAKQSEDFRYIVERFNRATNKRILEPEMSDDGSITLLVQLPNGKRHEVNMLSSGELIALQLLHFVKMHFARGSILLVDEPEQHLHPSLQFEIANTVRSDVGSGQLWAVTHSPELLNAVPDNDAIVVTRGETDGATHVILAPTREDRVALLADLGVAPGLWVPGNFIAVVEGPTDKYFLSQMLPEEFSTAYFLIAGNKSSVKSVIHRMGDNSIPYLAIIDRDGCSSEERDEWNAHPGQFMWDGYAIESLFLDPKWLTATLHENDPSVDSYAVKKQLESIYAQQKADIEAQWLRVNLMMKVPSRDNHQQSIDQSFRIAADVATARAEFLSANAAALHREFECLWTADPVRFIDPKRALGQFKNTVYRDVRSLRRAMIALAKRQPDLWPIAITELSGRVREVGGKP